MIPSDLDANQAFLYTLYALAKSSPNAWFEFLEAFNAYVASETEKSLMGKTSHDMAINVGRSQRLVALRDTFMDIEATYLHMKSAKEKRDAGEALHRRTTDALGRLGQNA